MLKGFSDMVRSSPLEVSLGKGVPEIMQQIYRRSPMRKCDINKVTSHVNLQSNFTEITLMGVLL